MAGTLDMVTSDIQTDPIAIVHGSPIIRMPQDLYIPPDALEVFLEAFEGPLDLLLYLIRRQNFDILDIPIAEITRQYMVYMEMMKGLHLELAAEYLVMAAMLAEIKSRMLLPQPRNESEEIDPRAELIRRLQEYERFKKAATDLDNLPRIDREIYLPELDLPAHVHPKPIPKVNLQELLVALKGVLGRAETVLHHYVRREPLSVRERISSILDIISEDEFVPFISLFSVEEGRLGVVVSFLAILELLKGFLLELTQVEPYGPIYVKISHKGNGESVNNELQTIEEYS